MEEVHEMVIEKNSPKPAVKTSKPKTIKKTSAKPAVKKTSAKTIKKTKDK